MVLLKDETNELDTKNKEKVVRKVPVRRGLVKAIENRSGRRLVHVIRRDSILRNIVDRREVRMENTYTKLIRPNKGES